MTVTYDSTTSLLSLSTEFWGLLGGTTLAHIHAPAPPGSNAPPATTTPTLPGFPTGLTAGAFSTSLDLSLTSSFNPNFVTANGGTAAGAEEALAAALADGLAYFNIHTTAFGPGEIRGNLQRVPDGGAVAALLVPLLLGLAIVRRRSS